MQFLIESCQEATLIKLVTSRQESGGSRGGGGTRQSEKEKYSKEKYFLASLRDRLQKNDM